MASPIETRSLLSSAVPRRQQQLPFQTHLQNSKSSPGFPRRTTSVSVFLRTWCSRIRDIPAQCVWFVQLHSSPYCWVTPSIGVLSFYSGRYSAIIQAVLMVLVASTANGLHASFSTPTQSFRKPTSGTKKSRPLAHPVMPWICIYWLQ